MRRHKHFFHRRDLRALRAFLGSAGLLFLSAHPHRCGYEKGNPELVCSSHMYAARLRGGSSDARPGSCHTKPAARSFVSGGGGCCGMRQWSSSHRITMRVSTQRTREHMSQRKVGSRREGERQCGWSGSLVQTGRFVEFKLQGPSHFYPACDVMCKQCAPPKKWPHHSDTRPSRVGEKGGDGAFIIIIIIPDFAGSWSRPRFWHPSPLPWSNA